jgi:hypothetical protein
LGPVFCDGRQDVLEVCTRLAQSNLGRTDFHARVFAGVAEVDILSAKLGCDAATRLDGSCIPGLNEVR